MPTAMRMAAWSPQRLHAANGEPRGTRAYDPPRMHSGPLTDLRDLLALLRERNAVAEVTAEVDPHLEVAEIHRRVIAAGGPALLFRNVKGAAFPLVTNLFGTPERVAWAFGDRPKRFLERVVETA